MASSAKAIVAGSMWLIGAQFAAFCLQFGYAAITARLVSPAVFGAYAVAVASMVLLGIFANAGLGQALARHADISREGVRAIATMSVALGCIASLVVIAAAPFWVGLWGGQSDAVAAVRWLAVSTLLTPYLGVVIALARRAGEFRLIAITQFVSAAMGLACGVPFVVAFRDATSLAASMIITQLLTLVIVVTKHRGECLPGKVLKSDLAHLRFSMAVTGTNGLYFLQQNLPKWCVGRFLGAGELGLWNRGEVLTVVPFQSVQVAFLQTLYPHFANVADNARRQRSGWTDMLVLSAWLCVPAGASGSLILPGFIEILYGRKWAGVGPIVEVLAVSFCLLPIMSVLASGLEQRGMFKPVVASLMTSVAAIIPFCVLAVVTRDPVQAAIGVGVSFTIQHALHLVIASREGLIEVRRLLSEYGLVIFACTPIFMGSALTNNFNAFTSSWFTPHVWVAGSVGVVSLLCVAAVATGMGRGPFVILRKRRVI